jgi:SAM-dependent methyltransferase
MPGWPDEGRRIVQGPHVEALLQRAAKESGSFRAVFNAGAGEGGYTRLLLALPGVESLVESDFDWRTHGVQRIDSRQEFFCASLVSLPLPDEKFDLVLCTEVLEHISEHEEALDELTRIMNSGGWLLITVPTPPAIPDPNHVREGYRPAELTGMLRKRGFEVVETRFCMHFFFRLVLSTWPRLAWRPRILIRSLSFLDVWMKFGPPMDLLVLARAK